jgi:phosphoglycerate kinase
MPDEGVVVMDKLVINQLPVENLRGKPVFVRIDVDTDECSLPAPLDESKLRSCLPTLEYLINIGARVIIGTHLGVWRRTVVEGQKLARVAARLNELLGRPVRKLDEAVGREALRAVTEMRDGDLLLLGNLQLYPGEHANDLEFAHHLAELCEVYCNDAFALAHLGLASTVGITRYVRPAAAGLELARELMLFEAVLDKPQAPFVGIVAGARIDEKLPILENLLPRLNRLFIGGALAFTFIKATGCEIGAAPMDQAFLPLAEDFLDKAERRGVEIILPQDFVVVKADEFRRFEQRGGNVPDWRGISSNEILGSDLPVDVGPRTVKRVKDLLADARIVFWNGPLGIWEIEPFAAGTIEVARALIERVSLHSQRIIVCGDSLSRAIRSSDLSFERLRHLTTGGEPALQLLADRPLPAVAALDNEVDMIAPTDKRPRTILLPVDGSEHSLEAARRIGRLVDAERAEISLLYVQKPMPFVTGDTFVDSEIKREREVERRLEAERVFASVNAALAPQGLISRRQLAAEGDPADEILKFANKIGADLIAMGSHGLTGVLRVLMGSVSRKVVDHAKCPVLILRIPDKTMAAAGMLET